MEGRRIRISRELIGKGIFDSIKEFRTFFYQQVESDVFTARADISMSAFNKERMLFVFANKTKINSKEYDIYMKSLTEKKLISEFLTSNEINPMEKGSYIMVSDEEVSKCKGLNQLNALFIRRFTKDKYHEVIISKEKFQNMFGINKNGEFVQRCINGNFKTAIKEFMPNATYYYDGEQCRIARNIDMVVQEPILAVVEEIKEEVVEEVIEVVIEPVREIVKELESPDDLFTEYQRQQKERIAKSLEIPTRTQTSGGFDEDEWF